VKIIFLKKGGLRCCAFHSIPNLPPLDHDHL
jgi:hypothetical protein